MHLLLSVKRCLYTSKSVACCITLFNAGVWALQFLFESDRMKLLSRESKFHRLLRRED